MLKPVAIDMTAFQGIFLNVDALNCPDHIINATNNCNIFAANKTVQS